MLEFMEVASLESVPLTASAALAATEDLHRAVDGLEDIQRRVGSGCYDALFTAVDCANAWNHVNKARVHTEVSLRYEECLQPALGLVNDAKCMIESLAAWKLGLTRPGATSILSCLSDASALVWEVLEDISSSCCLPSDKSCPACHHNTLPGDNFCSSCGLRMAWKGIAI